ncbi:MAG TPA: amino acid ABC transporter permease [Candidatus Aerophobetes bacterium]|uniref:Amino acid ABC transporter permease n=1 Tax=Aerophobetes bacterium TaxID=2030807 RepID=A0A7V5HZH8_UNCAE|nr:amino acid ABC transporter permease [Candidatus Aerophobetes bacterium]
MDISYIVRELTYIDLPGIKFMLKAALVTLGLSGAAIGIGSCIGAVVGWVRTFKIVKSNLFLWGLTAIYVDVIRGTPLLLQVYMWYYALPVLTGVETSVFLAGIGALCLYQGAYVSEAVRAGLEAIGKTQRWAGRSLGMSYWQTMRYIVFPQAIRIIIPPFIGICLGVIKDSSLVSTIGFIELARSAMIVGRRTLYPLPPWLLAAAIYFVICFPISRLSQKIEKKLRKGQKGE